MGEKKNVHIMCKYCEHMKDGNMCPVALKYMDVSKTKILKGFFCAAFLPWVGSSLVMGVDVEDFVKLMDKSTSSGESK